MPKRKLSSRRKSDSLARSFMKRLVRSVLAIMILSAFVLAIAFGVSKISQFNVQKAARVLGPYLARLGISESQVGQVAGDLIERAGDFGIEGREGDVESNNYDNSTKDVTSEKIVKADTSFSSADTSSASTTQDSVAKLAIMADTHIANDKQDYIDNKTHLKKALVQAGEVKVDKVLHVGDLTNWGVLADLREVKGILENSELNYFVLPGDRDLAQSVGTDNFVSVFSKGNQTFKLGGSKFVLLNNSANYTLLDDSAIVWFTKEIADADFVILSQPIFTEGLVLFNCQYMGSSCSDPEDEALLQKQAEVKKQRDTILDLVRNSDVKAVIAGDHHKSSKVADTQKSGLIHYVVGAVGGTVNEFSQKSLQSQRFSILSLFEDGSYDISDTELEITP